MGVSVVRNILILSIGIKVNDCAKFLTQKKLFKHLRRHFVPKQHHYSDIKFSLQVKDPQFYPNED